ncbi:hypothetical protein QVD17_07158 [Tagetes erecta]|uniref:Protein FAR1-RELATED SEQUENCE n=1 Tax=Tagetes erecta TaxID=13708 RepID=A0AAD8LM72_TARER|nr:hypothetical protein QVD17_07158 [Tagetes erecta]
MAMIDDPGGDQFYKEVGVVYVSPSSRKKYYTPCVSDYIKPVLDGFKDGVVFDTLDDEDNGKVRHRKPSKRVGCGAQIRLQINKRKKYEIYFIEEKHNHSFVAKEEVQFMSSSRNVGHLNESAIQALSSINTGPCIAFNVMKTLCELAIQRLKNKQKHLPNFSCEYVVKEDGRLGGLFWADEYMKTNYFTFGDVVAFDGTYRLNKYDMIFVPFTGVDNHNRNITLGAAILGNETAEMSKWLLQSYVKVFVFAPLFIVTNQDAAMRRAVEDVLPTSRHRLCMWHIWDKLTSKVGLTLCNTTDFKKRLARIVWTDAITPAEFEKEWHAILSDFDLTAHSWLIEIYKIREDWIPAYYRRENLSGLMRTTSRSESENSFFSQFFNLESTLFEFIGHFEAAMECQRYKHRKNDHETRYFTPDIWSSLILEKQAVKIFTRAIFLDQQLELIMQLTNVHLHIFYILRLGEIREFPRKYVLTRWTREAIPNNSNSEIISYGVSDSNSVDFEAIIREIRMDNEYNLNRLVANKEEMCRYRDHVKGYKTKADEILIVNPPLSRKENFKSQI